MDRCRMDAASYNSANDSPVREELHSFGEQSASFVSLALGHLDLHHVANGSISTENDDDDSQNELHDNGDVNRAFSLPQCRPDRRINQLIVPRHLPMEKGGFVSVQHHRSEGTTLLLWQSGKDGTYQLVSLINLPLSTQRKPQVSYDGKRLIVFGQDHIGLLIMFYRVMSSNEDFLEDDSRSGSLEADRDMSENSGGVINFVGHISLRYVKRIRHAGLGGVEYYDNIYMSHNERFVVVNTKTGNLIGTQSSSGEGLFVIDLEKY